MWFRSRDDAQPYLNETAVRIRAGIMLVIPLFMAFTLASIIFGPRWEVTGNVVTDTFDMDFDGRILYMVEAVRRTYDYTVTTLDLLPTAEQYLPRWLPLMMVWVCLGFMWMEAILGFCVGCQIHALFVKFGWIGEECEACNNLNFN